MFLLARSATVDRVIDAIKPFNPTVIQTNLTKDREEELVARPSRADGPPAPLARTSPRGNKFPAGGTRRGRGGSGRGPARPGRSGRGRRPTPATTRVSSRRAALGGRSGASPDRSAASPRCPQRVDATGECHAPVISRSRDRREHVTLATSDRPGRRLHGYRRVVHPCLPAGLVHILRRRQFGRMALGANSYHHLTSLTFRQ